MCQDGSAIAAVQGSLSGRLLRYDPDSRQTTVLAGGFLYANGVALSADESFAAVVETTSMRVHRHWLKGPKVRRVHCKKTPKKHLKNT
jgi:sugar lactone lactonase YvrE